MYAKNRVAAPLIERALLLSMQVLDDFRAAHVRIEGELAAAEAVGGDARLLLVVLKRMRREISTHFAAKDAFYVTLAAQCVTANDAAAAQLTRIFDSNMKMQSAAVVRFFENVENATPDAMVTGFRTMLIVIRQRFGTEEKAVFPLFKRTLPKSEEARP